MSVLASWLLVLVVGLASFLELCMLEAWEVTEHLRSWV